MLTVLDTLGDTKVGNLDGALVVNEDVRTFDVSMNDISLVEIVETLKALLDECADERFFKGTVIAKQSGHRATWYISVPTHLVSCFA